MFLGIYIYIHWVDHMPPHFHAVYSEYNAAFDFDGELISGNMPPKQRKLIAGWAVLHSEELNDNWEAAQNHKPLTSIQGLR